MTQPREITIRIEGRPPSANDHRHWRIVARDARDWKLAALRTAQQQMPPDFGPPIERANLEVVFVVPDRMRRDIDNLVAGQKANLDGLVAAKLLADDSTEVLVDVRFRTRIERGLQATVYTIREIPQERLGL